MPTEECPIGDCDWETQDPDPEVREFALSSHLKTHGKKPDGPKNRKTDKANRAVGRGSSSMDGGGFLDGILDGLGSIFD